MRKLFTLAPKAIFVQVLFGRKLKVVHLRGFSVFKQLIEEPKRGKFIHSDCKTLKMENTFCFDAYDSIGFDLDNTVVKYNVKNMIYHEYEVLSEFLIKKGYSKDFLSLPVDQGADFMQKGLILDFERGNLLRICPDGNIQSASHGSTFLTHQQIVDIYGESKRWEVTDEYCKDMLVAWNGTMADQVMMSWIIAIERFSIRVLIVIDVSHFIINRRFARVWTILTCPPPSLSPESSTRLIRRKVDLKSFTKCGPMSWQV